MPIFWVGGLTDALFPAFEPLTLLRRVQAARRSYPFKLFLGDLGHDYAAERQDEWDIVKPQMHAFVDHYLRPDRTPEAPQVRRGRDVHALPRPRRARALRPRGALARPPPCARHVPLERARRDVDRAARSGGRRDRPDLDGDAAGPNSYKGCRLMRPSQPDPTVATYEFPTERALDLMGGPVVAVTFTATGADVPLSVRLWDVAGDRSVQGLVTRATYRVRGAREPTEDRPVPARPAGLPASPPGTS